MTDAQSKADAGARLSEAGLATMGLQVLLLTRYGRTGASSRLRFLQYLPGLDEYGIDVHPGAFPG